MMPIKVCLGLWKKIQSGRSGTCHKHVSMSSTSFLLYPCCSHTIFRHSAETFLHTICLNSKPNDMFRCKNQMYFAFCVAWSQAKVWERMTGLITAMSDMKSVASWLICTWWCVITRDGGKDETIKINTTVPALRLSLLMHCQCSLAHKMVASN